MHSQLEKQKRLTEITAKIQTLKDGSRFRCDLKGNELRALLDEYRVCHQSKFHYDSVSWQIGSVLIGISLAIIGFSVTIKSPNYPLQTITRLVMTSFAVIVLFSWKTIHRRYAGFAEIANERAREIERSLGIVGLTIEFELHHFEAREIGGFRLENKEATQIFGADKTRFIRLPAVSEHITVTRFVWITSILSVLLCFVPGS